MSSTATARPVRALALGGGAAFGIVTFAATWSLWTISLRRGGAGGAIFLIGVFASGLVALLLTFVESGRRGVAALLGRIVRWRVDVRLYAFALLLMPAVKLIAALLYRAVTGTWPRFGEAGPLLLLTASIISSFGQAGEEVGWRGYLLPRLAARLGLAGASLVVGIIWGAWHLPLFVTPGAETYGQSFPLFVLQVTAYSVILAWVYWRSGGSLLLTMFMHSAFNNLKDTVPSAASPATSPFTFHGTLVLYLTIVLLWIVAGTLLVRMRGVRGFAQSPLDGLNER